MSHQSWQISDLVAQLNRERDPWREGQGFSDEVSDCQRWFGHLAGHSHNGYHGRYHTDHTMPTDYFKEWLWKLDEIGQRDDLFFTYLHSLSDQDYEAMGVGQELGLLDPMTKPLPARTMEGDGDEA